MAPATRALAFAHRWLGIAGGALFVLWFLSGLVMLYARMPALDPAARLERLPPLDLSGPLVHPAAAAAAAGLAPDRLRIGSLGDRPVYRFATGGSWSAVFADDGRLLLGMRDEEAVRIAAAFEPDCARSIRHDRFLQAPDQWTLQLRALLPLHRVACDDRAGTRLYVSDRTGEVVLSTDRRSRALAYAGPVTHWVYFTPLRRHGELWLRSLLVASFAGCLLVLSGLVVGIARFSFRRNDRRRGPTAGSPYHGLLRWHHYAGLVFGLVTFGWILSGGLSLDPWDWHAGTAPTKAQREGVAGGPLALGGLEPDRLREALALLGPQGAKELDVVRFAGATYLLAYRTPADGAPRLRRKVDREPADFLSPVQALEPLLVAVGATVRAAPAFDQTALLAAAARAVPDTPIESASWLERYDAYYYDRAGHLPLPVLRVRYGDERRTWLYLDPGRGLVPRREERTSRLDRWVYRGLHRWDFPWLHQRRPLWDVVVIALLLGGLALGATTLLPGLRRLRRLAARPRVRRPPPAGAGAGNEPARR